MTARAPAPQGHYRQSGHGRQQAQPRSMAEDISGTYSDPSTIKDVLDRAEQDFNLVGPVAFGSLPEGFSVVMSVVRVDSKNETYDVGFGKKGLSRGAVERIAGAAGVSTVRVVPLASAPNYAAFSVTVGRQDLDGSVRTSTKSRVMDLREHSGQVAAMREAARMKNKDADGQIREQRLHIGAHAETKAWLRAVRTLLSLRTYTEEELAKPFAVPKLQFTGRTSDPELRMLFAHGMMATALGGMAQIYGAPSVPAYHLGAGAAPPPQLGMGGGFPTHVDDDFDDEPPPPPAPRQQRAAAPPPSDRGAQGQPPSDRRPAQAPRGQAFVVPFGGEKDTPIAEASTARLESLAGYLRKSIDGGKSRFPDKDQALYAAIDVELRRRSGEVIDESPLDDGAPQDDRGDDPNNY